MVGIDFDALSIAYHLLNRNVSVVNDSSDRGEIAAVRRDLRLDVDGSVG